MQIKIFLIMLQIIFVYGGSDEKPIPYNMTIPSAKFSNPNYIKDRIKIPAKPIMPESWVNRFKKPFHPAWMDYCDPYHCNDYHKQVCGLNRDTMRFKWFQSGCHLILSNQCSTYRGFLKFDIVATKFCHMYVMFLRMGCPTECGDKELNPICAMNMANGDVVVFKNQCFLDVANCKSGYLQDYEEVRMEICEFYLKNK